MRIFTKQKGLLLLAVIGVLALLTLVIGGAYTATRPSSEKSLDEDAKTSEEAFYSGELSIRSVLSLDDNLDCSFIRTNYDKILRGQIYISEAGERLRGDWDFENNQDFEFHLIRQGEMDYFWSSSSNQGFKINRNAEEVDFAKVEDKESFNILDENVIYKCFKSSNLEDRQFYLPGEVAFIQPQAPVVITSKSDDEPRSDSKELVFYPVNASDHILGDPDARIKIIEYVDIDCPFCARFHSTMEAVMQEYGESGEVAWIYRHFPLTQLHPQAKEKANAAECVAEIGGNTSFWLFVHTLFERNENVSELVEIVSELGIDIQRFNACMEQQRYFGRIEKDYEDAQSAGAQGTPHSIIVVDGEFESVIPGAQPLESVKRLLDGVLENLPKKLH